MIKKFKISTILFLIVLNVLSYFHSCTPSRIEKVMKRDVLTVDAHISNNVSEIRELKYTEVSREKKHKDLHINGQLFIKTVEASQVNIKPCSGCIVTMLTPNDTSVRINMTTENDGFFSFHGKNQPYSFLIKNDGLNNIILNPISFNSGGITTIKIINALGSSDEQFSVIKDGSNYSWQ